MSQFNLKPTHAAVKDYYAALNQLGQLHFDNEAQAPEIPKETYDYRLGNRSALKCTYININIPT